MTPLSPKRQRFGLFPVRSPLLGESLLFSSPSEQQFRAASLILLAGLLIYQALVHGYFMKRMKNR